MRISAIEYKLQVRDFLNRSLTIDFKIVSIFFPVLFSIYKTLYSKHYAGSSLFTHEKIVSSAFQQNLPGLCSGYTEISWQIFDQIVSDKSNYGQANFVGALKDNFSGTYTNRVDFYSNFTVAKKNPNWYKKQKKLYKLSDFFVANNIVSIKRLDNVLNSVSLDELPLKLNRLSVKKKVSSDRNPAKRVHSFCEPVFFENKKNTKAEYLESLLKNYYLNINLTPLTNYSVLKEKIFDSLVSQDLVTSTLSQSKNREFNCNSDPKTFLVYTSNLLQSLQLLSLLEEFIYLDKNIEIAPRLMSGYSIPDINNASHLSLLKTKNASTIYKLESDIVQSTIDLTIPKNTLNSIKSFKYKQNIPNFEYLSKPVNYVNSEQSIYNGSSVFQNELTNELQIKKSVLIKKLVKQFLYCDNPLTDRQQSFFGHYSVNVKHEDTTSIKSLSKVPLFLKKKYEKVFLTGLYPRNKIRLITPENKPFIKYLTIGAPSEIFSRTRSGYIVYLNELDWSAFLNKLETSNKLNIKNIFPVKSFYQPNKVPIIWPLNQLDYKLSKNKLTHLPYSQNLSKETRQYLFSQTYKKKYSTYKNNNFPLSYNSNNSIVSVPIYDKKFSKFTEFFYQILEPISHDSWLYITQFSIGFFLIRIFQNLLQKYQQEMKYVISSLLENKDSNSNQPASEQDVLDSQFRIIKNIRKNFDNIAGIDAILPELGEIIWFLRNSGRSFKTGKTIPQGILLTGPPGTGKTLLVQAIAGEAEVPVLIESASSLHQPGLSITGSERLKNLFAKAREIAPCIVFIDEIDTFGTARNAMMENPLLTNTILDSIYPNNQKAHKAFIPSGNYNLIPKPINAIIGSKVVSENQFSSHQSSNFSNNKRNQEKYNVLMQFLIELDGVATDKKVLIFGATNRPQILDSALTRPGRFNKTLHLKLPNKQKRIEIVKLYSNNIGIEKNISWEYIANLTIGLSAADLASAINQSSIQAIQAETIHTIKTIEYGIESVTGYSSQKNKLKTFAQHTNLLSSNMKKATFINRLAYYQAGKIVVHTLVKNHPAIISIGLWPELRSQRYYLMQGILEKKFSQIYRRVELESRIIGFYAGKAGEFINLFATINQKKIIVQEKKVKNNLYTWQSDLGIQDISFASWLAELMVNKWYLYSKKLSVQNFNQLDKNYNTQDIRNIGIRSFLETTCNYAETKAYKTTYSIKTNSQTWFTKPWLQKQVVKQLEFSYSTKNNWYKIYGGDHEENENTRYLAADTYYHNNTYLNNLNSYKFHYTGIILNKKIGSSCIINWTDISCLNRDYIYHNLILTCFNKAVLIIDQNRELFDLFATSLLQKDILRQYEIRTIIEVFYKKFINLPTSLADPNNKVVTSIKTGLKNHDSQKLNLWSQRNFVKVKTQDSNKINTILRILKKFESSTNMNLKSEGLALHITKKITVLETAWGNKSHNKLVRFIKFNSK